ncbi:MAG: hypothetical protein AAFW83_10290 [Pseudomonadota bacterium]
MHDKTDLSSRDFEKSQYTGEDVFISFPEPLEVVAEKIKNQIEKSSKPKISVYMYSHTNRSGDDWRTRIHSALESCIVCIGLIEKPSNGSQESDSDSGEDFSNNSHPTKLNSKTTPSFFKGIGSLDWVSTESEGEKSKVSSVDHGIDDQQSEIPLSDWVQYEFFIAHFFGKLSPFIFDQQELKDKPRVTLPEPLKNIHYEQIALKKKIKKHIALEKLLPDSEITPSNKQIFNKQISSIIEFVRKKQSENIPDKEKVEKPFIFDGRILKIFMATLLMCLILSGYSLYRISTSGFKLAEEVKTLYSENREIKESLDDSVRTLNSFEIPIWDSSGALNRIQMNFPTPVPELFGEMPGIEYREILAASTKDIFINTRGCDSAAINWDYKAYCESNSELFEIMKNYHQCKEIIDTERSYSGIARRYSAQDAFLKVLIFSNYERHCTEKIHPSCLKKGDIINIPHVNFRKINNKEVEDICL